MPQNSFSNTQKNTTEKKTKEEKISKLSIDNNYDFVFLKNWPPVVRWLLVIPAGILAIFLAQFAFGYIVNMIHKSVDSYYVSLIVDSIFMAAKFLILQTTIVAVAPVKKEQKFKTGIILSILPIAVLLLLTWTLATVNQTPDTSDMYYPTITLVVQLATGLFGIIWALYTIKRDTNKPNLEEPMQEAQ